MSLSARATIQSVQEMCHYGRRFWGCPIPECDAFFEWIDPSYDEQTHSVIKNLWIEKEEALKEMKRLRDYLRF